MRFFIIFIIALCVLGCYSVNKPKKPDNLISKDKMAEILYDVFILNAAKGANKIKLEDNGIFPKDYVYEKYNIDSLQFAQSNEYYGFLVEDYEQIIGKVEERITNEKVKYQNLIDREEKDKQRKRDSIKSLSDSIRMNIKNKNETKKELERVDYKNYPDTSSK